MSSRRIFRDKITGKLIFVRHPIIKFPSDDPGHYRNRQSEEIKWIKSLMSGSELYDLQYECVSHELVEFTDEHIIELEINDEGYYQCIIDRHKEKYPVYCTGTNPVVVMLKGIYNYKWHKDPLNKRDDDDEENDE